MTTQAAAGLEVRIQRLAHGGDLPLPVYATAGSAGLDLAAAVSSDVVLPPGGRALVPTGFAIALPEGHEAQIRPRSGLAVKGGITVLNAPGTINSDYRGEIMVCLINHGDQSFTVSRGARIAQMVVAPVSRVDWQPADHLEVTARDGGGFGSTGLDSERTKAAGGSGFVIRLPKKLLFAVEAVLDIAYNAGNQPVQSKEITARQGIPRRYLEQVLQKLVRAGILSGVRGPRGGYLLARERRRITLGDITRVISAPDTNGEDADGEDGSIPESGLGVKVVRPIWDEMQDQLMEQLDAVTIEQLCLKAKEAGIDSEAAQRLDFVI